MLCILLSAGFDIKIDEYVSYMKQHLNDASQLFERPGEQEAFYSYYSDFGGYDLFQKYMDELRAVSGPDQIKLDVEAILEKKEGWGIELEKYASDRFALNSSLHSHIIDIVSSKEWSDLLFDAEAEDIHYFRFFIIGMRVIGEKEAEILQEIQQNVQNKLDHDLPDSKIVAMQLRWLVRNIKKKLGSI